MKYNEGPYKVIVFFSDDSSSSPALSENATKAEIIRDMQKKAKGSENEFMSRFGSQARNAKTYWLINGAAMTATTELINSMVSSPLIEKITFDGKIELPPTKVETSENRDDNWTYGLKKIRIPEVHSRFNLKGKGVVLGIIDTGCHAGHPDLDGKVIAFKDFVNNYGAAYDDQGHGTHCSGTMVGGNLSGKQIGVAPEAKLIVAKALGGTNGGSNSVMIGAMEWMADPDGNPDTDDAPVVVNCSWGAKGNDTSMIPAVEAWVKLNIFPCFAAGNSGPWKETVGIPGGYLASFAIGSTTDKDKVSFFSSRGPVKWDGVEHIKPDVSAPGSKIFSAKNRGGYVELSGTSMACPHVAGVIGLLHQAKPGLKVAKVREILESTAKDLGSNGKDNKYGAGRIDVVKAIEKVLESR